MATLRFQASSLISSSAASASSRPLTRACRPVPTQPIHEPQKQNTFQTLTYTSPAQNHRDSGASRTGGTAEKEVVQELYAIMDLVADRVEMHRNVGVQRDNWNHLLLTSINGMTLAASAMAGLAAAGGGGGACLIALKLSSVALYVAATGILGVMNRIQPSQLAEEQRNAARLFRQLHEQIKTKIALGKLAAGDVGEIMDQVLALDRAYPLPLLGAMLDKFPKAVEPAVWWPRRQHGNDAGGRRRRFEVRRNGWNEKLEEEMREIVGVLKKKDEAEYLRLSNLVLKVNKVLAICGPLFTSLAAVGVGLMGSPLGGPWAELFGPLFGALATVVNTIEHGGQVGMVFEMYRSSAGYFVKMEESIEAELEESEDGRRENGEMFETEVALQLGRSLPELKRLVGTQEFASRLF